MSNFKRGAFAKQEPERKALREKMRKAFFSDLGLTPATDVQSNDVDLKVMAGKRAAMLSKARGLHEDDTTGLDLMEAELAKLGLGMVPMPGGKKTAPNLKALTVLNLSRNFFYTYRG